MVTGGRGSWGLRHDPKRLLPLGELWAGAREQGWAEPAAG